MGSPDRTNVCPCARRVRPHGRSIFSTKVTALPESLGQCKLLEYLCVPPPARPPPPALVAVPVLRCCMCVCTPRQARVVMGQNSSAVARAQGRVKHRARGIAGGGQLAQPEETVSTPPPRRAGSLTAAGATREAKLQELYHYSYIYMYAPACIYKYL
jgi:hypothetical protein